MFAYPASLVDKYIAQDHFPSLANFALRYGFCLTPFLQVPAKSLGILLSRRIPTCPIPDEERQKAGEFLRVYESRSSWVLRAGLKAEIVVTREQAKKTATPAEFFVRVDRYLRRQCHSCEDDTQLASGVGIWTLWRNCFDKSTCPFGIGCEIEELFGVSVGCPPGNK